MTYLLIFYFIGFLRIKIMTTKQGSTVNIPVLDDDDGAELSTFLI